MNRRHFFQTATSLALGGLCLGAAGCASDDSGAGSSATTNTAATNSGGTNQLQTIGVQLYTVRSLLENDFEGTLRQVADIGYDHFEFAGYYGRSPEEIKALLDELGVVAPSTHIGLGQLRDDLDGVIQTAQAMGHAYVICPWLPEEERGTIAGYRELAQFFNEVGAQMQEAGIQFGYHNHDFEFQPIDGTIPYDVLLQETNPEHVTMELDLYWIVEAGYQPLNYFAEYPGRFTLSHVKDRTQSGKMVAVGQGTIDFAQIFAHSDQAGLQHYIVEHDNPENPIQSIRTSYQYLDQLRF